MLPNKVSSSKKNQKYFRPLYYTIISTSSENEWARKNILMELYACFLIEQDKAERKIKAGIKLAKVF